MTKEENAQMYSPFSCFFWLFYIIIKLQLFYLIKNECVCVCVIFYKYRCVCVCVCVCVALVCVFPQFNRFEITWAEIILCSELITSGCQNGVLPKQKLFT